MADLITMDGWSQRSASFRFELVDTDLETMGELEVSRDNAPSLENRINRTIKRSLSGLVFNTDGVNILRDRVRVWMIMQDTTEYPLGVFLFADTTQQVTTSPLGKWHEGTLVDQGLILDQANSASYGLRPNSNIVDAIEARLAARYITQYDIQPSTAKIRGKEWVTWPAGTTDMEIINDLCQLAGFYSLYFDNFGVARARSIPDMDTVDPDFVYGIGGNIFADTITRTNDLLTAPNRYIVINNSMTETSIAGRWDIPASAPHSVQNRGIIVTKVIDSQAVESKGEATALAKRMGQTDTDVYEWLTLSTPINPFHDTFNIVEVDGVKYHEQAHTMVCSDGSDHKHELRRIYTEITDSF